MAKRVPHPDHVKLLQEAQEKFDRAEFKLITTFEQYQAKLEEFGQIVYDAGWNRSRKHFLSEMKESARSTLWEDKDKPVLEAFIQCFETQYRCRHLDAGGEHTFLSDEQQADVLEGIRPDEGTLTLCEDCSKAYNENKDDYLPEDEAPFDRLFRSKVRK